MNVGLRIDVDTLRGTRDGVPQLCRILASHGITATFFFSVGPDNMGRHLFRLLRPSFLKKMVRSNATRLYGWDIVLRGTFWPGAVIGKRLGHIIRSAADAGHEIGLHAWDHHHWQAHLDRMDNRAIYSAVERGFRMLETIIGQPPLSSAAPAWKCNDRVLLEKSRFPFKYNSDCRGESLFFPSVNGQVLHQPQIPSTLPTYDEVIGQNNITDHVYNDFLLSLVQPGRLNVLTIHAEVEGMACKRLFNDFLSKARSREISFCPLGNLLECPVDSKVISTDRMVKREQEGREGWIAFQSKATRPLTHPTRLKRP